MILFIRLNQKNEIDKNNKINRGSHDVQDREETGQRLADRLTRYRDESAAIILALPRGGVAVGYQLSLGLHLPLDVFITSHGRKGLSRFLLGSVSHTVVHHVICPVLVLR